MGLDQFGCDVFRARALMSSLEQTTRLALDLGNGDQVAGEQLVPLIYDELRACSSTFAAVSASPLVEAS